MSRSFTIDSIYKRGRKIGYKDGRFLSSTPAGAARKAFSHASRGMKGRVSLEVHMRETTQGSKHKVYSYKISRIHDPITVTINGDDITYKYQTKVKSM